MTISCRSTDTLRFVGALLLPVALTLTGCSETTQNPIAPTASSTSTFAGLDHQAAVNPDPPLTTAGQSKGSVCHATEGAREFVLISVPADAVDAHLAHGDALVGSAVPDQPAMIFNAKCTAIAAPSTVVTVTFGGLSVNGASVPTYTESGVTITATQADWKAVTTYGHPQPFIQFMAAAGAPAVTGQIRVTTGGALFTFNSVDLYSSTTSIPYTFTGLLGSTTVFSVTGTQPQTFGLFATVANSESSAIIDTLVITLTNTPAACCSNPMGLDNIVIRR